MRTISIAVLLVLICSLFSPNLTQSLTASAAPPPPDLIQALEEQTGGTLQVEYHSQTGVVRFIGAGPGYPIRLDGEGRQAFTGGDPSMVFLEEYGSLFGIRDAARELSVLKTQQDGNQAFTRYQQRYQGVPVLGGEIIVQTLDRVGVLSAMGEFLPDIALDTQPALDPGSAQDLAVARVAKLLSLDEAGLVAGPPDLWIYNPALLGGPGIPRSSLVWRTEVTSLGLAPIRYLVLVDAQAGIVLLEFNQVDTALSAGTYTANNTSSLPGSQVCDQNNPTCSGGDEHAVAAHRSAIDTYNFYASILGRDSIDNAGLRLVSTVHYRQSSSTAYDNAFWNGVQMVYGDAYGFPMADDVVAHELTHGVTQYESGLFYYFQSGAINEALSDIFGEFLDQWNGRGSDEAGYRWQMGEDVTGMGAMRSMSDPTLFGDPDRMTSYEYDCTTADNGGVHGNSGVANKAAYLMTDGGSFNGQSITGLGLAKSAQIWYMVQRYLLTSAADYLDLGNSLTQACYGLLGKNGITSADCTEVKKVVAAVEMKSQPLSCQTGNAETCSSGTVPVYVFNDNLENPSSGKWTSQIAEGSTGWAYPQNPNPLTPYGWDMTYATSGKYNMYGYAPSTTGDFSIGMTNNVSLPAGGAAYLVFNHAYSFESGYSYTYDGGRVEYSLNGGPWQDAYPLIDSGLDYNAEVFTGADNPLSGELAFGGASAGYGSTRVNLSGLQGQAIRFRFRIGTDWTTDDYGWYIDDVRIFTCFDPSGLSQKIYLPVTLSPWE